VLSRLYICVLVCSANFNCSSNFVNCGGSHPKKPCVHQLSLCDDVDDCGNKWDELPETCGQFALRFTLCPIHISTWHWTDYKITQLMSMSACVCAASNICPCFCAMCRILRVKQHFSYNLYHICLTTSIRNGLLFRLNRK